MCLELSCLSLGNSQAQNAVASGGKIGAPAALLAGADEDVTHLPSARGGSMIRPAVVGTSIQVTDTNTQREASSSRAEAADVQASAGTYGDFSRYAQVLPGVVFNSDVSNDVLVRGGNPLENLYLLDGFEVPNINHITSQGSTGGLNSMVDTATIGHVDLLSGGYGAAYDERLSSVLSIAPRELGPSAETHGEAQVGYVGLGGLLQRPLGSQGDVLISGHHSLLNMVTNDVGLNGVPTFTNMMGEGNWKLGDRGELSFLSLSGSDSIAINPCSADPWETNLVQTQYSGWRTTNGIRWSRSASARTTTSLSLSDSEQGSDIDQQQQTAEGVGAASTCGKTTLSASYPTLYRERNADGMTLLQYDTRVEISRTMLLSAGSQAKLNRVHYNVMQPNGQLSPLSTNPEASDATSFLAQNATGATGSYAELSVQASDRWNITGGAREQTYSLDGSTRLTPRLRTSYRLGEHQAVHAAFGEYAQLPPSIYFFAFPVSRSLAPIRARHLIVGGDLWSSTHSFLRVEAYRKDYRDYPVSTEFPQLSLANMVDTLGQQFIWLPMVSRGRGVAQGIELSTEQRFGSHLFLLGNVAYAKTQYAGLDGVKRPGNFDYPLVVNVLGIWRSGAHYEASTRYEQTSGRPYTPYLLQPSLEQDRGIYDVTALNADRGPAYSRLDLQFDRIVRLGAHQAYLYAGVNNTLNRDNFEGLAWQPRCVGIPGCVAEYGAFTKVSQMPIYPDFGVRYTF
ncbi:TonB-dependent siderophore receptor [Acidipila sp. EB88]|uniref:TonB-dependent receptor plug domain-containing protein n=1 Tax=Acidipila sp. EB88 TaxID=2305226 RepID=UPI00131548C5|nr:TonB-dependent receptor [Acidipila sp. EB88]